MIINGFLNASLIEYPGQICALLYTSPCNFKCPFCHNPSLIPVNSDIMDETEVMQDIYNTRQFIDAVTITGGEPTMQNDLEDFFRQVKSMGLKAKIDTNGYSPETIKRLVKENLVDYIALDIKNSFEKYKVTVGIDVDTSKIKESIDFVMKAGVQYEFRTTVVPKLIEKEDFKKIGEQIKGAEYYVLQQYNNERTLDKTWRGVKPYTKEDLEEFAGIMRNYAHKVEIFNI